MKTETLSPSLTEKHDKLVAAFSAMKSVLVAYSGGVDSSLLAYYARQVLGKDAHVVIAVSPSLAQGELAAAREQARLFDFGLIEINTEEVDSGDYQRNDGMRCFFCKSTLFEHLQKMKEEQNIGAIVYGANLDDLNDVRPGHQAAANYKVLSPLLDNGLGKEDIRALAAAFGLPSHDRPQAACLSSRFPKFVAIDAGKLALIDRAEDIVRGAGFKQVRVRYKKELELASVEIAAEELPRLKGDRALAVQIENGIKQLGFAEVFIDPLGYRQGGADLTVATGK